MQSCRPHQMFCFRSIRFPGFIIGANHEIMKLKEDSNTMPLSNNFADDLRKDKKKKKQSELGRVNESDERSEEELFMESLKREMEEEMKKEVEEAVRIKLLLLPARSTKRDKNMPDLFHIDGNETLGSYLRILPCSVDAPKLQECSIQWYFISKGEKKELIAGATKSVYATDPFDIGRVLKADITTTKGRPTITVEMYTAIERALGLEKHVEDLARSRDTHLFNVVVIQKNNKVDQSIHEMHVGKNGIKLHKEKTVVVEESYTNSMELYGVRDGRSAAAQVAYWKVKSNLSYVLAFESGRERNAAIMLARRFASKDKETPAGPDKKSSPGSSSCKVV